MTIGIGALCSYGPRPQVPHPTTLILVAGGTIGTPGADYAFDPCKLFLYPEEKLFGVCVGDTEKANDLLRAIQKEFQQLTGRNYLTFAEALNKATFDHRARHFHHDVLPSYRFLTGDVPPDQQPQLLEAWQQYDVGVHMVLGTFDDDGQALMYVIARMENVRGWVHRTAFPGTATIGHGGHSANFWLRYRRQVSSGDLTRSAYLAYEAAHIALKDFDQKSHFEVVMATRERAFHLASNAPEVDGCPVSLQALENMFERYGPSDVENDLTHSNRKTSAGQSH